MRFALLVGLALGLAAAPTLAQDQPPNPFGDPEPSDPDEGPGTVFTDPSPPANTCASPCPTGTGCVEGRCVWRCDPPCGPGQQCSDSGICIATSVQHAIPGVGGTAAPGYGQAAQRPPREPMSGSVGVIRGVVGMGMAALPIGLGLAAWSVERGTPSSDAPLFLTAAGAASTLAGVLVARSGSSRLRRDGGATGIPFFRVTTWIFFGAAMLFDLVGMVFSTTSTDSQYATIHLAGGLLGGAALLSAGADALVAGLQQNALRRTYERAQESSVARWIPRLGRMRDATGAMVPALGWSGAF